MKVRWQIIALSFLFLLSSGALGITDPSDCDNLIRDSEIMQCYHSVAISAAYLCQTDRECTTAQSYCNLIWNEFKDARPSEGENKDDIRRKAELLYNTCYYDIARILGNPDLCDAIRQEKTPDQALVGEEVSKDLCEQEAESRSQIAPEFYFQNNTDSICTLFFVLPLLLVLTLQKKGHP